MSVQPDDTEIHTDLGNLMYNTPAKLFKIAAKKTTNDPEHKPFFIHSQFFKLIIIPTFICLKGSQTRFDFYILNSLLSKFEGNQTNSLWFVSSEKNCSEKTALN